MQRDETPGDELTELELDQAEDFDPARLVTDDCIRPN
jgi:hypothetical protein